ncbi:MAG: GTPase HflX [Hyphomicrobiaceae bacterium]|nr:GTPase HflX [Hyphomicrobiaceae bacterium]
MGRRDARLVDHVVRPTPAIIVTIERRDRSHAGETTQQARAEEFVSLASAINLDIRAVEHATIRQIKPATFLGGGHVQTIAEKCVELEIELVILDCALTPIQQRNLERAFNAKVLDRTGLILEIFGARAATREGTLQVELAHLKYQRSRLVRSWTHLERQRGGLGFIGGPGETQIEADRRLLSDRIALLEKRIEEVRRTRQLQRKPRDAVPFPLVALVGYTNAGKSTLFNLLTGAGVMAKDMLFATLDTTVRKVSLPHGRDVVMSDTVGFIADLPTELVAAFRATLEEVSNADLILHVRDISNPDHAQQAHNVLSVLSEIGIDPENIPIVEVWNKCDLPAATSLLESAREMPGSLEHVAISAVTGEGIDTLLTAIETRLARDARVFDLTLPHGTGDDLAWLYGHCEVLSREDDEQATHWTVRVLPRFLDAFRSRYASEISNKTALAS